MKNLLKKLFYFKIQNRAQEIFSFIKPFIDKNVNIIDIGCGSCSISALLKKNNINITSIDIEDKSIEKSIKPIIYDGRQLPFKNNKFDTALLIFVLHHAKDPTKLLEETKRVANNILVIEDIYKNNLEKLLLHIRDNLLNFNFTWKFDSFKNDIEWKNIFKNKHLTVINTKYRKSFYYPKINIALYILKKY